ncbi:alpha/beta fold hydrolase [Curtobacterium flaccumfaciens]|uniref:alpha/beta fold hydrolase n=1 Tax=Curtobacterium flaccumfaciens TaxID=2035 RepID=UPI0039936DC1
MTRSNRTSRTTRLAAAAAAIVALGLTAPAVAAHAATPSGTSDAHAVSSTSSAPKPTIVLVHGAWADGSSFAPVTALLQHQGYTVLNAPNPLRGLASDAANVAAFVNQNTTGPVILVGHSYGGSVITNAALSAPSVKGLVYVDAYAPDAGESALQLTGAKPGSMLGGDPSTVFNFVQYPGAPTGDVDTYVKPELFTEAFAAHLPKSVSNVLAASEAPAALGALTAPSGTPAWKTIPSYFFIGTQDAVLPPAEQQAMAKRAHGVVVTAKADHLSMLETPLPIEQLIVRAAKSAK